MPTNAKNFSFDDRIKKTIFKGRPTVFSSQDLNRYLDVIHNNQQNLNRGLGAFRENWEVEINSYTTSEANEILTYTLDYSLSTLVNPAGENAYVYYKGVRFTLSDVTESKSFTHNLVAGETFTPIFYLVLIAEKETIKFTSDPDTLHVTNPKEFSGVKGTDSHGNNYELPSSDSIVYGNERTVLVTSLDDVVLSGKEEFICVITTIRPTVVFKNSPSVKSPDEVFELTPVYNAFSFSEVLEEFPFLFPGFKSPYAPLLVTENFGSNNGFFDFLAHFIASYKQSQSFQDYRLRALEVLSEESFQLIFGFNNGFASSSTDRVRIYKEGRRTYFAGKLTSGELNTVAFNLPELYRPKTRKSVLAFVNVLATTDKSPVAEIKIDPSSGEVAVNWYNGAHTLASDEFVALDGVFFNLDD